MTQDKKKLVIFSSIAAAIVIMVIIIVLLNVNKTKKEEVKKQAEIKKQNAAAAVNDGYVRPKVNRNGELINDPKEYIGKILYSKKDPTTIRTSPKVDNPTYFFPMDNNILGTVRKDTPIGVIQGVVKGPESPPMNWIKVKLPKPMMKSDSNSAFEQVANAQLQWAASLSDGNSGNHPGPYSVVYVRADVGTFKPYKK